MNAWEFEILTAKSYYICFVGVKKIDADMYKRFVSGDFGSQSVTSLQLCSMDLPKDRVTGYYFVAHEVQLSA